MNKTTVKEYTVRSVIDYNKCDKGKRHYLLRTSASFRMWVVLQGVKTPGAVVPTGTPYYNNFDDAMNAFNAV